MQLKVLKIVCVIEINVLTEAENFFFEQLIARALGRKLNVMEKVTGVLRRCNMNDGTMKKAETYSHFLKSNLAFDTFLAIG